MFFRTYAFSQIPAPPIATQPRRLAASRGPDGVAVISRWPLVGAAVVLLSLGAHANERLVATGGVTQIEGAGGGGLVPWALVTGYGTRDQIGGSAFATDVNVQGFRLRSYGAAVGLYDRVEVSVAKHTFSLGDTVPGQNIHQDVAGIKLKLSGDAVFDQDTPWPQWSIGIQQKHNLDFGLVPKSIGAKSASGTDIYVSATKLYLAGVAGRNLLLNGTLRATKANQFGILGFGGDKNARYRVQAEASVAVLLKDNVAVGVEFRQKPDNLSAFKEENSWDVFAAWFPHKNVSITAAYLDLGNIANKPKQHGPYVSLQGSF
jgi:hypothetical protein